MRNPFLIGEQIYLRTIEPNDLNEEYISWFNDPEVCRFNDHHRFPMYREKLEDYYDSVIKSNSAIVLAIITQGTDEHIGNVSLQGIDLVNRSAEFALIIGNKFWWGKGVGREVGRLMLQHGFENLHLHRIYCGTASDNEGMKKLALALGFIEEGKAREALFKNGEYRNLLTYSILEHEFSF